MTHPQQQLIAELLAALKALTQDSRFNLVIGGNPYAVDALVKQVDLAIAKAEAVLSAGAVPQQEPQEWHPMAAGWCVRVSVFDDLVVSISERELAGRDLTEADEELIRECARHLLSFVGRGRQPTALDETWRAMGINQTAFNATNSAALETELAKQRAPAVPSLPAPLDQALEALAFAHGAIVDAIGCDDGLDGHAGAAVLKMIRAALTANGRTPPDLPTDEMSNENAKRSPSGDA